MAKVGQTHEHGHGSTVAVSLAGVSFLMLAAVELVLGQRFGNPAVRANAAHDALDGLTFLIGGTIIAAFRRSVRHGLACTGPKIVSMGVVAVAIILAAIVSLIGHSGAATTRASLSGIILGAATFGLNAFWHRRLKNDDHDHGLAGFKFDLVIDMATASLVVIAAGLTWLTSKPIINSVTAWLIVAIIVGLGLLQIRTLAASMHRQPNHPSVHEH